MGAPVLSTAAQRPDLFRLGTQLTEGIWPAYNTHGDVLKRYWGLLPGRFGDFQFTVQEPGTDAVLGQGFSIPCHWDGTAGGLPAGIDEVIAAGFADPPWGGRVPQTLAGLAVEIPHAHQGRGVSSRVVEGLRWVAVEHGFGAVIVPLRPVWKERYPLVAIERYLTWTRGDGLPFDPWLRLHVRLGATVVKGAPHSLRITAPVADWEGWTGMAFPESGDYVFPHGLAVVSIDREVDRGTYYEPNIWVCHRV